MAVLGLQNANFSHFHDSLPLRDEESGIKEKDQQQSGEWAPMDICQ